VAGEAVERLGRIRLGDESLEALGERREEQGLVEVFRQGEGRSDRIRVVDRDELAALLLVVDDAGLGHRLERARKDAFRAARAAGDAALLAGIARQEGHDAVGLLERVGAEDERIGGEEPHAAIMMRPGGRSFPNIIR